MPLSLEPGSAIGQYRILALLGRGGMGEVYAAEDTKLGRKVAIKILPASLANDAERLRRFTQEAKAASALNHPSILTIYDVDEIDGYPFLVSEFIDGRTLRDQLRQGVLTLGESIEIAGQIANALAAAHAAGIVHRDVKPENIMLRADGHAKLVDFGLAKVEHEAPALDSDLTVAAAGLHTTPGLVMGTTQYMSPEQARGLKVDARSDIFSLGVVLYEMAAGRPPFHGDTPSDVIAAILHFDPPPITDAPPDLEHVLQKALEKNRDERHQTAKDLAADLKRLRRRLDPSVESARLSTSHGQPAWASTPKSGGPVPTPRSDSAVAAAPTPASSGAAVPAQTTGTTPAVVAPPWTSIVVRFVWLSVAAFGAVTAIGLVGCLGLVGISWLQNDNDADERAGIENLSFENLTIEKVSGLGQVASPAISQDGKLLAYVASEGAQNAIWLRQMATGSVLRVVGPTPNTLSVPQFTPDGSFLYYNENTPTRPIRYTLKAAPAFGGTAREILEGRLGQVSFAPDGKRFTVVRETPTAWELLVVNADGTNASVIGTRPAGVVGFETPVWSPSGSHLAVLLPEVVKDGFQTHIQIMKPDGSDARTLTAAATPLLGDLQWATDEDAFIATGHVGGLTSPLQVLRIDASDGSVDRITKDVNSYFGLSFSRGSGAIATVQRASLGSIWIAPADRPEEGKEIPSRLSEDDGGSGVAWLNDRQLVFTRVTDVPSLWMTTDDGGARRLTEGALSIFPSSSRDGQTVVFISNRDSGAMPQLYRLTLPDGRVTRLAVDTSGAISASVSPDGREVFFKRAFETPAKLFRMPTDGGSVTPVLEAPQIYDQAISPDGTRIAVIANSGVGTVRNLILVPANNARDARTIYETPSALESVRWYPSGDALLLKMIENRQANFFRLSLAGGPPRQLTRFPRGGIGAPAISPDGRRIAYYRGTSETDIVLLKPRAKE
jgi:serine/threonine protein kinase/Tol biopolymer transport system component